LPFVEREAQKNERREVGQREGRRKETKKIEMGFKLFKPKESVRYAYIIHPELHERLSVSAEVARRRRRRREEKKSEAMGPFGSEG
jgi:hypothetical protein